MNKPFVDWIQSGKDNVISLKSEKYSLEKEHGYTRIEKKKNTLNPDKSEVRTRKER